MNAPCFHSPVIGTWISFMFTHYITLKGLGFSHVYCLMSHNDMSWSTFTRRSVLTGLTLEQWLCRSISLHGRTDFKFPIHGHLESFRFTGITMLLHTPVPSGGMSVGSPSTTSIARPIAQENVGLCPPAMLCAQRCRAGRGSHRPS